MSTRENKQSVVTLKEGSKLFLFLEEDRAPAVTMELLEVSFSNNTAKCRIVSPVRTQEKALLERDNSIHVCLDRDRTVRPAEVVLVAVKYEQSAAQAVFRVMGVYHRFAFQHKGPRVA